LRVISIWEFFQDIRLENAQMGDADKPLLDAVLKKLEDTAILPSSPTFEDLLLVLEPHKCLFPADYFQTSSDYILETFLNFRIEKLTRRVSNLKATKDTDKSGNSDSSGTVDDERSDIFDNNSDFDESNESFDGISVQPTLDEETTVCC
jgi:hypothetical protein